MSYDYIVERYSYFFNFIGALLLLFFHSIGDLSYISFGLLSFLIINYYYYQVSYILDFYFGHFLVCQFILLILITIELGHPIGIFLSINVIAIYYIFYNRKGYISKKISPERMFFHDLINQTHSINLFLNQKIILNKNISSDDLIMVENEVKVIQALIGEYFKFDHKNLEIHNYGVSFKLIKNSIYHLAHNFLGESADYTISFKNKNNSFSDSDNDNNNNDNYFINYPIFYRILTNIIKNITEVNSTEVSLLFEYEDDGITIYTKNKFSKLKEIQYNRAPELSKAILDNKEADTYELLGVGLSSISEMVKELNGSFTFGIEGDFWVNKIFLPNDINIRVLKKSYKKAS